MDSTPARRLTTVEGYAVRQSRTPRILLTILCAAVVPFSIFWVMGRWSQGYVTIKGIVVLCVSAIGLLGGALSLFIKKRTLIIGSDRYQVVGPKGVEVEVPYANIVNLKPVKAGIMNRVEVVLLNPDDPATTLDDGPQMVKANFELSSYHTAIGNYPDSPNKICKLINEQRGHIGE